MVLFLIGHHNQLTKLNGGSKNQKQAVGFYAANYHLRMDMDINILHTPQVPLVQNNECMILH
jgi:DNA-directed RNA polymerase beta subunit